MRIPSAGAPNADSPQWKVLITDEESRKLIDNVVKEDDILDSNITSKLRRDWRKTSTKGPQTLSASKTGARHSPTLMQSTSSHQNRT